MSRQPISNEQGVKECTLCHRVVPQEEATHLELYVIGSEGIIVCLECRIFLTKTAEGIMHTAGGCRMRGYQMGLDAARKYDKEHPPKGV